MNIEQEVYKWLKEAPYWLKYASQEFLAGKSYNSAFGSKCYNLFLEDHDLKTKDSIREDLIDYEPNKITSTQEVKYIKRIKDIKNVNALEKNQEIQLSKQLTIIFGENGSGKSGYARLLNNAFNSRGDKEILPNINKDKTGESPGCSFEIVTPSEPEELKYPESQTHRVFSQYSVFDSKAGVTQLTQENTLIFTPKGFDYFEKLILLFEQIKKSLLKNISERQKPNEFLINFRFENSIQKFVSQLSEITDVEELKLFEVFKQKDQIEIESLIHKKKKLSEENIPEKIESLSNRKTELITLGKNINSIKSKLSKDDFDYYNSLIELKIDLDNREKIEGIEKFNNLNISNIGSIEWKSFVESSLKYIELYTSTLSNLENCPLCLQSLSAKEKELFNSYWNLLKSQVQKELLQVKKKIEDVLKSIDTLPEIKFDSSKMLYDYMSKQASESIPKIESIIQNLKKSKKIIIEGLNDRKNKLVFQEYNSELEFLNETVQKIDKETKFLIEKDPSKELKAIQDKINELSDKKILSQLVPSIIKWLNNLKWAKKATEILRKTKTNGITKKQGELFEAQITTKYKSEFEKECKSLRAPLVVEINQRNEKGTTLRRLQVKGKSANKILSEGEQKAISIADFLTENNLDDNNIGIILDDPVTSLDYKRRDLITRRLVKEASKKQVVIFTHNISFLMRLQQYAKEANIESVTTTIRKVSDSIGVIKPEIPWIAQNVSKRIKYLRNELVKLKKIEESGDSDFYSKEIKSWYGLLREGWERSVEERLLKGVIVRFGLGVSTQRLKNLEITDDFLQAIEKGMTESSNWAHDSAAGLSPTLPTHNEAEKSLQDFDEFCKRCKG